MAEQAEQEAHEQLLQARALLPQNPAEAMGLLSQLLQKYQGRPEIAETLGINVNTAYSRLRLAREEFTKAARRLRARRGER